MLNNGNTETSTNICFTQDESMVVKNLISWMLAFIIFYLLIGLFYSGLSIDIFVRGINDYGIKPFEYYSLILLVIGIVALILAKELWGVKKNLSMTLTNETESLIYLGKSFNKIKNYFFIGAIFLVSFIVLFLFILYYMVAYTS